MNNSHLIQVKFLGPTNSRGSRMKISTFDLLDKKAKSKVVSYDYSASSGLDQVLNALKQSGFDVVGINSRDPDKDYVMLKWDFEKLQEFFNVKD